MEGSGNGTLLVTVTNTTLHEIQKYTTPFAFEHKYMWGAFIQHISFLEWISGCGMLYVLKSGCTNYGFTSQMTIRTSGVKVMAAILDYSTMFIEYKHPCCFSINTPYVKSLYDGWTSRIACREEGQEWMRSTKWDHKQGVYTRAPKKKKICMKMEIDESMGEVSLI